MPLVVHAPVTLRRLGLRPRPCFDILELWAFVRPACPAAPTVRGSGARPGYGTARRRWRMRRPCCPTWSRRLLARLAAGRDTPTNRDAASLAVKDGLPRAGYGRRTSWRALGSPSATARPAMPSASGNGCRIGRRRRRRRPASSPPSARPPMRAAAWPPSWDRGRNSGRGRGITPPPPPPRSSRGKSGATRPVVLAEAGTGTGKTLGYVAPASLWAERNGAAVWISTYTRHLQRQVEGELGAPASGPGAAAAAGWWCARGGRITCAC